MFESAQYSQEKFLLISFDLGKIKRLNLPLVANEKLQIEGGGEAPIFLYAEKLIN